MTSAGPAQTELPTVTQDANEESSAGSVFQHPWAPKIVSKELPTIEQQHPITINYGTDQWIPENLLFRNDIRPGVDSRLAYSFEPRAVAQPSFTCIPSSLWGAVGNPVMTGEDDTKGVGFEEATDPATQPPVARMVISTDTNNVIIVEAEQGRPSITVVDIQRAIIRWMKETRTSSGVNNVTRRFSKSVRMTDDDGTEAELEIWVWKGLRLLSTDMSHWHLHLREA